MALLIISDDAKKYQQAFLAPLPRMDSISILGDCVYKCQHRVKLFDKGKLHSKWKGPFTVVNSTTHDVITIQDNDGNTFKVNGQRLKLCLEPSHDINQEIDEINLVSFDEFTANL